MKRVSYLNRIRHLICCPNCGNELAESVTQHNIHCQSCRTVYFALGDIPCLFENGVNELDNWKQQLSLLAQQERKSSNNLRSLSTLPYLGDATKRRIYEQAKSNTYSQKTIADLFKSAGVSPALNEKIEVSRAGRLSQYHELFLRDWCWGDHEISWLKNTENKLAASKIIDVINDDRDFENVLFLGSGAGRLSWDIHKHLQPKTTLALDMNPLLSLIADKMIKTRCPMKFPECKEHPPIDGKQTQYWPLTPIQSNIHLSDSWFPLLADAWSIPLKRHSFDLVVTSWFIDVNGADIRDFIGLLDHLLEPGGLWINNGPLLYGPNTPIEQKYGTNEIRSLIKTAGFAMVSDQSYSTPYLYTPESSRYRVEQPWLFSARKENLQLKLGGNEKYPWITLPHLAIPAHIKCPSSANQEAHSVFNFIDGRHSINDISLKIAPHLPAGVPARDYVIAIMLTHT